MNKAAIRKITADWSAEDVFIILHAFHYLSEFENVREFFLDCQEPPEDIHKTGRHLLI